MKLLFKILVLSIFLKVNCILKCQYQAFKDISRALAAANYEVSVISVNGRSDFIESVVLKTFQDQNVPHSILSFKDLNSPDYKGINTSAVIAFDSINSLKSFNNETYTCTKSKYNDVSTLKSDFYYPFQFFVYCPGLTHAKLTLFEDQIYDHMLRYEYFFVDESDVINIYTFVWYTPEKCNQIQLKLVNRYFKETQTWETDSFVIEKFEDFQGCELKFFIHDTFPGCFTEPRNNSEGTLIGYLPMVAEALSEKLNYIHSNYFTSPDGVWNYDLRWFLSPLSAAFQVQNNFSSYGFYSTQFEFRETLLAIPKGSTLDSYERIVRPFDTETWIWCAITFAAAFTTIFIVKFVDIDTRNFIIGNETSTPGLNVLRIFFGVSLIRCSKRSFSRFLFMSYILFCIVIRTAYQAKMFQFLQMEIVKPTFDTIDELIENKFTFYMRPKFAKLYKGSDFVER